MTKKPQPCAKCLQCEQSYTDSNLINEKCPQCGGAIKSELRPNSWFECQVCNATGIKYNKPCLRCIGEGWLLLPGKHSCDY
jgi:DnaJ-class molecular chaperone